MGWKISLICFIFYYFIDFISFFFLLVLFIYILAIKKRMLTIFHVPNQFKEIIIMFFLQHNPIFMELLMHACIFYLLKP
jgi:hypothetical protein